MRSKLSLLTFLFIVSGFCYAQEEEPTVPTVVTDSVPEIRENEVVVINDSVALKKTEREFKPLAPSKAAFYSALVPGLGQVYNKKYWKVPLVYGAIGGSIYAYTWNNDNYQSFRTAFKRRLAGFTDDEYYDINNDNLPGDPPDLDQDDLEYQQERFQSDRDLWLVVAIGMYALNIVDANVDAHLKQFNIDDDLSIDFEPYFDLNQVTNSPNYGMALIIKF
ncbi:DUF5683 domain-containing protein [Maribacter confluentis]|uniref:DUF5683 domain-containing protein n=1 Tax=Maribacter confluentis TaxID=1656093 RepID=A0ABT8RTL9_9FLAO|nr:DUF5683 domain-containing protein [Maribacter confluentis]MDO1514248.1 DUF5683 domain-containing protein [Maribacter confluentis]